MDLFKLTMDERMNLVMQTPWRIAAEPFQVAKDVYFVGNSWVSCFLLDTAKGLVLIDCSIRETTYLLIDSIHRLGFDPKSIRYLLLSHAHFDHCGAARMIQEMSGCEIWLSEYDQPFLTERRDCLYYEENVPEFKVDHFYDYGKPLDFGNLQVFPVHCPGHTPGTTSFFFTTICDGRAVTCAMHGGLGTITLEKSYLDQHGLPYELRQQYVDSIREVMRRPVDIVLPSHAAHAVDYDFLALGRESDGSGRCFLDGKAWERMLKKKLEQALKVLGESV